MWKLSLVVSIVTIFACSQLPAQGIYFGPQIGIYKATDADNARIMGGVALRLKLTSNLGAEGSINFKQEEYADGRVTVRSWPVMVSGLYYPIPIVYGVVGVGWYDAKFEYDNGKIGLNLGTNTKQEFGWHFGAGADLPIGFGRLVGDVRYVFLNYDFKQIPGSPGLKANFYMFNVGFLFELW